MPSAVIFIPHRPLCDLFAHAFTVAGWSADRAQSPLDALAIAFNSEAHVLVTDVTASAGVELVHELERDDVLREIPVAALSTRSSEPLSTTLPHLDFFEVPCDPYWVIAGADRHLGRETMHGIGRRPFSEEPYDLQQHAWWWTLAAADLMRQVLRVWSSSSDHATVIEEIGELTYQRTGVNIETRPFSDAMFNVGGGFGWEVREEDEELRPEVRSCIAVIANALASLARMNDSYARQ